jgi:integrase
MEALVAIQEEGQRGAAHRCAQFAARVFRFAIRQGYYTVNPAGDLRGGLKPRHVQSHAGVTNPNCFALLMYVVDAEGYGFVNVRHGLQLLARIFVRPVELRAAEWPEFDRDSKTPEWKIPSRRMKMRRPHLVPLSTQAVEILKKSSARSPVTGSSYSPSVRVDRCPMLQWGSP